VLPRHDEDLVHTRRVSEIQRYSKSNDEEFVTVTAFAVGGAQERLHRHAPFAGPATLHREHAVAHDRVRPRRPGEHGHQDAGSVGRQPATSAEWQQVHDCKEETCPPPREQHVRPHARAECRCGRQQRGSEPTRARKREGSRRPTCCVDEKARSQILPALGNADVEPEQVGRACAVPREAEPPALTANEKPPDSEGSETESHRVPAAAWPSS
jgi:hypothetical protein